MTAVAQAQAFSLRYPDAAEPVLRNFSFRLGRGERVLLLGPSGSGKSSLTLCLNGLIPHSIEADVSGALQVFGQEVIHADPADLAQRIGIVFQDPESQFCTLTVEDEIAFGLENLRLSRRVIDRRIDQVLGQVGLRGQRHTRLDRLSGGMAQRVALAAILAMNPALLVLDEATSNLDPAGAAAIFSLVAQLARTAPECTFLIIEHRLDALLETISRVWVVDEDGRLRYDAPPRTLFTQEYAALAAMGIWQPPAMSLAHTLRQAGVVQEAAWLTLPEALAWLRCHPHAWDAAWAWAQPTADPGPSAETSPAVALEHVSFSYANGTRALHDLSLSVRRGEVLAVVGGNGAGKSTLAQLMVGLLRPQQGTVRVDGDDTARLPASVLARRCGFVFQNPEHQFVTDRVYDEIAFGYRQQGVDEARTAQATRALLERLNLSDKENANPFALSQGQKRRLSVATMLTADRSILILDEPTFGQDERNSRELVAELRRLNQAGMTLVLVTHDMELVWALAQRVAVMADGRLLAVGPVDQIFADADLLQRAALQCPARAVVAQALQRMTAQPARTQP